MVLRGDVKKVVVMGGAQHKCGGGEYPQKLAVFDFAPYKNTSPTVKEKWLESSQDVVDKTNVP